MSVYQVLSSTKYLASTMLISPTVTSTHKPDFENYLCDVETSKQYGVLASQMFTIVAFQFSLALLPAFGVPGSNDCGFRKQFCPDYGKKTL